MEVLFPKSFKEPGISAMLSELYLGRISCCSPTRDEHLLLPPPTKDLSLSSTRPYCWLLTPKMGLALVNRYTALIRMTLRAVTGSIRRGVPFLTGTELERNDMELLQPFFCHCTGQTSWEWSLEIGSETKSWGSDICIQPWLKLDLPPGIFSYVSQSVSFLLKPMHARLSVTCKKEP